MTDCATKEGQTNTLRKYILKEKANERQKKVRLNTDTITSYTSSTFTSV